MMQHCRKRDRSSEKEMEKISKILKKSARMLSVVEINSLEKRIQNYFNQIPDEIEKKNIFLL